MATDKLNLYQRIRAVMHDVEYLTKDDSVGSGSYAYKAISEEKVTQTVRVSLIKHGLVIFPIEQVHTQKDHVREGGKIVPITTVDVKYKIVNIDNPEEFEILASSGTGVDPQDKGVGKAMTYSFKYLGLRTFWIPTGEDPDKVHNDDLDKQQRKAAPAPAPKFASQEQKDAIIKAINHPVFTKVERDAIIGQLNNYSPEDAEKNLKGLAVRTEKRLAAKVDATKEFTDFLNQNKEIIPEKTQKEYFDMMNDPKVQAAEILKAKEILADSLANAA